MRAVGATEVFRKPSSRSQVSASGTRGHIFVKVRRVGRRELAETTVAETGISALELGVVGGRTTCKVSPDSDCQLQGCSPWEHCRAPLGLHSDNKSSHFVRCEPLEQLKFVVNRRPARSLLRAGREGSRLEVKSKPSRRAGQFSQGRPT
jgi:hypothetical protein